MYRIITIPQRTLYSKYISHHGILGQRWGKRNGPPYPLGASDHSYSEKKAGWRKSLDKPTSRIHNRIHNKKQGKDKEESSDKSSSDKLKKAVKIGAAVVAVGLVSYGAVKLVKSGKLNELTNLGKNKVGKILDNDSMDSNSSAFREIKRLSHSETIREVVEKANPHRGDPTYKNNCTYCAITSFLRTIGYNITAKDTGGEPKILQVLSKNALRALKYWMATLEYSVVLLMVQKNMLIKKFGQNASGVCSILYKGSNGRDHVFNWIIQNGMVEFFDGQDAKSEINHNE